MLVIGLMSGTSVDGVDAALVDIRETRGRKALSLKAFRVFPFSSRIRRDILRVSSPEPGTVRDICLLNGRLGEIFARAAAKIASQARIPMKDVRLIGSHGQTIHHLPLHGCTLQIGEPSMIAERTGVTTIADFRQRDVAAGGHGAPLTPLLHYHLFHNLRVTRAIQNIGGISNMTVLPAGGGMGEVLAFDTGPGNMIIDGLIEKGTGKNFDRDGRVARKGRAHPGLLTSLLSHPYLRKKPPKTTGREEFGRAMVERIWREGRKRKLPVRDMVATATTYTARTIADAYIRFVFPRWRVQEIIVGGGGVRNRTLLMLLREYVAPVKVSIFEDYGYNSDAIEAMAFALLAYEAYKGRPNSIPSATGARKAVVMGKILPGNPPLPPLRKGGTKGRINF